MTSSYVLPLRDEEVNSLFRGRQALLPRERLRATPPCLYICSSTRQDVLLLLNSFLLPLARSRHSATTTIHHAPICFGHLISRIEPTRSHRMI